MPTTYVLKMVPIADEDGMFFYFKFMIRKPPLFLGYFHTLRLLSVATGLIVILLSPSGIYVPVG